ncbi:hypothetical protein EVAR_64242_1 [Eumeta japonica]|uniref:Uncharacterized protein n=1 Tax=Eumeta variegata TaxID=151549 RepID=A0A4C1ZAZ5_EUMVA|nr:hypothetical protein EVAR_64242_1 [Eumeta japonica]
MPEVSPVHCRQCAVLFGGNKISNERGLIEVRLVDQSACGVALTPVACTTRCELLHLSAMRRMKKAGEKANSPAS